MSSILSIIIPLFSLAGGVFAGKVFFSKANKNFEDEAKRKADDILKNAEVAAENLKKDRMLEAKEISFACVVSLRKKLKLRKVFYKKMSKF